MSSDNEVSDVTCSKCQCNQTKEVMSGQTKTVTSGRVSPSLIQIKAESDEEVKRRIEAFIKNKRNEIDERNIREFISPFTTEAESSCARVEAMYVHREGGKSHIVLKHVDNADGPQTQNIQGNDFTKSVSRVPVSIQRAEAVEERLANMEAHLAISKDDKDVFSRLKALEGRINFLEGLSPEYFRSNLNPLMDNKSGLPTDNASNKPHKRKMPENLSDINKRIRFLKEVLRQKAR